jgi:hypothetical protein
MIRINIQNVEEMIFYNDKLWKKIPDLRYLREQWKLSKITPILRPLGKKSLLDFLNNIKKEHEKIISEYFGTDVTIDKLDYFLVKNLEFEKEDAELELNFLESNNLLYPYFSTYLKNNKIYVTFWR